MTEYANRFEVHGLDLNAKLNAIGRANLQRAGVRAILCRGTVEALPYRIDSFDCVRMEDDSLGFASPAFDGGR